MFTQSHRRLTALGIVAILGMLVACTANGEPEGSPTVSAETSASASPTATPTAQPPSALDSPPPTSTPDLERSRAAVDEVISAVEAGDVDALEALVLLRQVPCSGKSGGGTEGPPFPGCGALEAESPVPAFAAGVCWPVWYLEPRAILKSFVERAGALYAAVEGPRPIFDGVGIEPLDGPTEWDYRVIFVAEPTGTPVGYEAVIAQGKLVQLVLGCQTPSNATLWLSEQPPTVVARGAAYAEPTQVSTAAPSPPAIDPLAVPRGTGTGDPAIDAVIEAMGSQDAEVIRTVIGLTPQQCTFAFGLGNARCLDGMTEGTVVDTFWFGHCDAGPAIADAETLAREFADLDLVLYAVSIDSDGRGVLVYDAGPTEASGRFFLLEDGLITGVATYGCSSPAEAAMWAPLILRGPAWPADE